MSKQSSVEWLWHNLTDDLIGDLPNEKIHEIYSLVLQAKQMHKEEIEDAWDNGAYGSEGFMPNIETSQEYYNERFKGGNNE